MGTLSGILIIGELLAAEICDIVGEFQWEEFDEFGEAGYMSLFPILEVLLDELFGVFAYFPADAGVTVQESI